MKINNKQPGWLIAIVMMLVMVVSLVPGKVCAEDDPFENAIDPYVFCPIEPLEPKVNQNGKGITPTIDTNTGIAVYTVAEDKEKIYVDYIASLDMSKMRSILVPTTGPATVWDLLAENLSLVDDTTEVTMEFQLDPHLILKLEDWRKAIFESSTFDWESDRTTIDANNKVTLYFKWNQKLAIKAKADGKLTPIIKLSGVPMLVRDDWQGSSLELTNSGSITGKVSVLGESISIPIINSSQSNTIILKVPEETPATVPDTPATPVEEPTEAPVEAVKLTFDPNGGIWPSGSTENMIIYAAVGDIVRLPLATSKEGANFVYWEGSRYNPGELYEVTGDHYFTAHYEDYSSVLAGTTGKTTDGQQNITTSNQNLVSELPKTGEQSTTPAVIASLAGLGLLGILRKKASK